MTEKKDKKFDIVKSQKEEKDLKQFFFDVYPHHQRTIQFRAILAYDVMEAVNLIRSEFPQGTQIDVAERGQVSIKSVLNKINLGEHVKKEKRVPVQVPVQKEEKKKYTKKQFINNLLLVTDNFIKNEEDKKTLQRIIKKIK